MESAKFERWRAPAGLSVRASGCRDFTRSVDRLLELEEQSNNGEAGEEKTEPHVRGYRRETRRILNVSVRPREKSDMIISRDRRILFVHIQRTGGHSVEKHLAESCADAKQFIGKHATAAEAKAQLGDQYASYTTFSFVRNPWDRLVSWYNMIQTYGPTNTTNRFWAYVLANSSCFGEFITNCTGDVTEYGTQKSAIRNQLDYLSDSDGNILVGNIGRFESFANDLTKILTAAAIPAGRAHREAVLPHKHYSTYYTDETRDIVASRFQKDINYFGYEYEEMA